MTRRSLALAAIVVDVAKYGKLTRDGIRAYVENRISAEARNEAMRRGMAFYEKTQQEKKAS